MLLGESRELILWIGPLLEEGELEQMVENGECDTVSANLAEWNFLKYFVRESNSKIIALSAVRTIEWPKNKVFRYGQRSEESYFDGRLALDNVGFCNVFGVSHLSRSKSLVSRARELAAAIDDKTFVNVFVYSMHLPFMKAASAFKAGHDNCSYKLIVPDLPLNMNTSTALRKVLKRIDWQSIQSQMSNVDGYILYTRQMAEYLRLSEDSYMVCEGIANADLLELPLPSFDREWEEKRFIYAGSLDAEYRVENLVKAFGMLDNPNARLEIYGKGSGEERVKNACSEIRNALYCGYRSNKEIISLMRKATFVVNPRPIDLACAEYSCPSKTLEAMACGVPMLTTRLPGIPENYLSSLLIIDGSSISEMARSLSKSLLLSQSEMARLGYNARKTVSERSRDLATQMLSFVK